MAATVAASKAVSAFPARFLLTAQAPQQQKLAGVNKCEAQAHQQQKLAGVNRCEAQAYQQQKLAGVNRCEVLARLNY